jgi:Rieske Fe-S protein
MNRRNFIQKTCTACLSVTVMSTFLSSCQATHYISGTMGKDGLTIPLEDFRTGRNQNTAYRSFVIVRNDALQYPICVYRLSQTEYSALWLRCSHQGAELQVSGDAMHCPAHGSEFNNRGQVTSGPAPAALRSFPVTLSEKDLFIDLRRI